MFPKQQTIDISNTNSTREDKIFGNTSISISCTFSYRNVTKYFTNFFEIKTYDLASSNIDYMEELKRKMAREVTDYLVRKIFQTHRDNCDVRPIEEIQEFITARSVFESEKEKLLGYVVGSFEYSRKYTYLVDEGLFTVIDRFKDFNSIADNLDLYRGSEIGDYVDIEKLLEDNPELAL